MARIALWAALVAVVLAQSTGSELVELDVVAVDRQDFAISDLTQADFQVREDGAPVAIRTFTSIVARGVLDEERSVVLLMDDIGISIGGTSPMQQIGRLLLSPMQRLDEVGVVRLSREKDGAFGDPGSAMERVAQYRGGMVPYSARETPETVLNTVARIATELEPVEHRRKVIVCLGGPVVCDVPEPVSASMPTYHVAWTAALSAAARANVSVYEVDPTGLTQASGPSRMGLIRLTGGEILRNSNDFNAAAAQIWREASHYYLLGYWATPSARGRLRSIEVTTRRRDVHLRARRLR